MNAPTLGSPKDEYLAAMKADSIPSGWSNLWFVHKLKLHKDTLTNRHGKATVLSSGSYTYLRYLTDATLYDEQPGAVVMEDTPFELRTHLGFVIHAHGNVLVTGLGLGCVVRGLLKNPNVAHVTCIENSPDVLKLVGPYMPTERLTIIEADAFQWTATTKQVFDCAWHDLWTNREQGEPHLDIWHASLFETCRGKVKHQGAWGFDRRIKVLLQRRGFQWIG